jgi:hypothetical protein
VILADSIGSDLFRAVLQGTPPGTVYALVALGFVLTFPISPKWQMVLFGLGAIQFARHPEGLVEASKQHRAARAVRRRAVRAPTEPAPAAPFSRVPEQEGVA